MKANSIEEVIKHYPEITGIHPACLAVPEISDEDRHSLEKSIAEDGLRHEIVLTKDGLLIDGRNRLIACFNGRVEPRFKTVSTDPWHVAYAENIARRHLEIVDRCKFGKIWSDEIKKEAEQRKKATLKQNADRGGNISTTAEEAGKSRDAIGSMVGVSGRTFEKYEQVVLHAPEEVVQKMHNKEISVDAAYKEASRSKKQKENNPVEAPVKPSQKMTTIVTASGVESEIPLPSKVVFNQTNDSVDWASWTWNPVTGCEHGCKFCYAREIAHSKRMELYYPNKFEPTFHPYRLDAPANTAVPNTDDERDGRVFVCSMADLFGKWVPRKWIELVFASCLASPEWTYLFLTKWPARYSQMPLIENAWYGASVIQQSDVKRVESAMQKFDGSNVVRWISLEPMLEPIVFEDLSWCDMLVIGAQTSTTQPDGYVSEFAPEFDWIVDVVNQCREFGVPYYLKANLGLARPGMKLPTPSPRIR